MKNWLLCTFATASALASSGLHVALAPDELFRKLAPSVWQVATLDAAGKPLSTGSAVVMGPETLVTNCHVLKGAASLAVRQEGVLYRARLQHADTERDLCIINAARLPSAAVQQAAGAPQVGQRIYTIGSPKGLEATLSDGLVSGLRRAGAGVLMFIQISAPISPGSSGGGLFDDEGQLLGITTSGVVGEGVQSLNFARPVWMLAEVPERAATALQRWREAQSAAPVAAAPPQPPAQVASVQPVPPQPVPKPVPATSPPREQPKPWIQPGRIASGFAAIDDVDAVPYLNDRGRAGYREWLTKGTPRAFALAPNGSWAFSNGLKGRDPDAPPDPNERALWSCARLAGMACRLYAVNNVVVWSKDPPANAHPATPAAPALQESQRKP